ncbi:MAG: transcriptional regulator [Firmicutes bacterium]|nr:transcriptional regulator [Bacillota bacterium]
MIYIDDSTVKVGGVILPGLFKSMEIKGDALIEEQDVEGRSTKPKQAAGYEDAKINLELILQDGPVLTKLQKLAIIQNLFKKQGQEKPIVYEIVNEHTAVRGITQVLFKNLTTKEQNKNDELSAMIEFWEYIPMTITATKAGSTSSTPAANAAAANLNPEYQGYLTNRGAAPKLQDKTATTAAADNAETQAYKDKLGAMPY